LISQQVGTFAPEIVKEAPINSSDDTGEKFMTIQYDKLIPVLVQAIKEQQLIIASMIKQIEKGE
jgi:hypothetical protein